MKTDKKATTAYQPFIALIYSITWVNQCQKWLDALIPRPRSIT